jgi:hypothetical protein
MIKLNTPFTTTVQYLAGTTVTSSTVTDTLYVQDVRLDFSTGAVYATIARGTITNGVFGSNYPSVTVTVNPDGSFISDDGKWSGTVPNIGTLIANLKTQFDQFILASGAVQGVLL